MAEDDDHRRGAAKDEAEQRCSIAGEVGEDSKDEDDDRKR